MAALAYPYRPLSVPPRVAEAEPSVGGQHSPRKVAPRKVTPSMPRYTTASFDLRRVLPSLATLAIVVSVFFGASALVSTNRAGSGSLPGGRPVPGGYSYVVQAGDTLWSIATRLEPHGDPRPLVDELTGELGGSALFPGEQIHVDVP